MRRHQNTLYITSQGAYLAKDGANIVVRIDEAERARVPIHGVEGLVCFGRVSASPALLGFCAESQVGISFMTEYGRFLARVEGPISGNVLLRREQYRRADDPAATAALVRSLLVGKIYNQRSVLRRALRDHGAAMPAEDAAAIDAASVRLRDCLRRLDRPPFETDTLRGIEGEAAQVYFSVFGSLLRGGDPALRFNGRSRRPPLDPVNAVLSFVYALLAHDVRSALETVGLDPAVGFLHRDRPGRPGLALDLMEEFRPFFADRLVLSLFNRRQLSGRDFLFHDGGACTLNDDGRKAVLVAYQERKQEELTHPFLDEKCTIGLLWHLQARLLARHLRGDGEAYVPFTAK